MNTPFETMTGCASSPPVALKVNVPSPVLTIVPGPPSLPAPLIVTSPSAAIFTSFACTSSGSAIVPALATVAFAYGENATCSFCWFSHAATATDHVASSMGFHRRSAAASPPAVAV